MRVPAGHRAAHMNVENYRNVIIGSGEGGKYLAWHLAQSGQQTVVVERRWVGGSRRIVTAWPRNFDISRFQRFLKMGSSTAGCIRQIAESIPELLNHKVERANVSSGLRRFFWRVLRVHWRVLLVTPGQREASFDR